MYQIDVFWSFRSPWSYLATRRLRQWHTDFDLSIRFRPVYPLAIRDPEFFHHLHPLQPAYFLLDLERHAQYLSLPLVWPSPDPVLQYRDDRGRLQPGEEQPYIHDLTRLGVIADDMGQGIAFADEVSSLIWGGTENWHQGDHLQQAAARAGLDLEIMQSRLEKEHDSLETVVQTNQQAHADAGHWGVPTCVYRGEPFFGQDRLELLLWRLKQDGLDV